MHQRWITTSNIISDGLTTNNLLLLLLVDKLENCGETREVVHVRAPHRTLLHHVMSFHVMSMVMSCHAAGMVVR